MRVAWLIERGQPEGLTRPEYWTGYGHFWTTDPNLAFKFLTREYAENAIHDHVDRACRAVEHGWYTR